MLLMSVRVAIVCPPEELHMAVARAFDAAPADWDVSLHAEPVDDADVVVAVGCEIPGAVSMDPSCPEQVIADIAARLSRDSLIVVVGASGGCGATSVLLHLAAASARHERTGVVDLGSRPDALSRLGLDPEQLSPDAEPLLVPVSGGFRLVYCGTGPVETAAALGAARTYAARVFVDLPPAVLDGWVRPVDRALLVMTPTGPSARKAAGLMEERPDLPWVPITNRVGPGSETTRIDIERILGRRLALELPCSPGLRDAEDDLKLLTSPLSPWRMRIQRLSDAL